MATRKSIRRRLDFSCSLAGSMATIGSRSSLIPGMILFLALALPTPASTQASQPLRLPPASATLREQFSNLTSLRELNDGRVILTDFQDNRLLIADFAKNTVSGVGRTGDGPGEYQRVSSVVRMGHDSTLMGIALLHHWIIIDGGLRSTTVPMDTRLGDLVQEYERIQFDNSGLMLGARSARRTTPEEVTLPVYLVLSSLRLQQSDTIEQWPRRWRRLISAAETEKGISFVAFPTEEYAAIASDGWVALVHPSPYRIDWRPLGGNWIRGMSVSELAVRVDAREKAAFLERLEAARADRGGSRPGAARNNNGGKSPPVTWEWPQVIPPFVQGPAPLMLTDDAKAVVERTTTADSYGQLYDVFNRRGVREYQLLLPPDQHILGFGKGVVYVVKTNDDGTQELRRHPWRPARRP